MARIAAIAACRTGVAHTMMAAAALQKAATSLGHSIKVETQDAVGSQNTLTPEDIAAAEALVIAADMQVDTSRFAGQLVYITSTKQAIHAGREVIQSALIQTGQPDEQSTRAAAARPAHYAGIYRHLLTGVSYTLPIVVAGGLSMVLAFAVGGIYPGDQAGTLAAAFDQIGRAAFGLFVAVLSAFVAYSIAERPGIAPGLIGGLLAQQLGAGFLGALASGLIAGYVARFLAVKIRLPPHMAGLMPVLILPFLSTLAVGLLMIYVVGPPVQAILVATTGWLKGMQGTSAVLLGVLLGAMMAFDMGGPINKASYAFAVDLLAGNATAPMAAVMVAGMTPPLGLALAAFLFKNRFDLEEQAAAGPALVLGLSYITEGAIPFAAKDPLRVIPSLILGSAVAGGLSMLSGVHVLVPHGGMFAALIPGAVTRLPFYLLAILAGTLVTAGVLFVLKCPSGLAEL